MFLFNAINCNRLFTNLALPHKIQEKIASDVILDASFAVFSDI